MRKRIFFLAGAALFVGIGERASASLLATFNLDQQLYEFGEPFYNSQETTPVTDTALPFQRMVSQTTATNGVTATYNAYDNGAAAGLNISSSAYTTALNNVAEEGGVGPIDGGNFTTFSFTQPVSYTIVIQVTASSYYSGELFITAPSYPNYIVEDPGLGTTFSQTGTLSPGIVYTLDESFDMNTNVSDPRNPPPANESGTDSISLTFTAIPEPGSLSLIILPAAMLARRRRRAASVRI